MTDWWSTLDRTIRWCLVCHPQGLRWLHPLCLEDQWELEVMFLWKSPTLVISQGNHFPPRGSSQFHLALLDSGSIKRSCVGNNAVCPPRAISLSYMMLAPLIQVLAQPQNPDLKHGPMASCLGILHSVVLIPINVDTNQVNIQKWVPTFIF